jgi:hypothetical protein
VTVGTGAAGELYGGTPDMASILTCSQRPRFRPWYCGAPRAAALLAGFALLTLAACSNGADQPPPAATPAQAPVANPQVQIQAEEYQRIITELRRVADCVRTAEGKPDFAPLRAKAPEGGRNTPYPTTFLDKSKASPAEQGMITSLLEQIAPCQPNFGVPTVRVHQSITRMISDTWQTQSELYRHLKEGVITWGIFNQETRSNADKLSGGLQALRLSDEG